MSATCLGRDANGSVDGTYDGGLDWARLAPDQGRVLFNEGPAGDQLLRLGPSAFCRLGEGICQRVTRISSQSASSAATSPALLPNGRADSPAGSAASLSAVRTASDSTYPAFLPWRAEGDVPAPVPHAQGAVS